MPDSHIIWVNFPDCLDWSVGRLLGLVVRITCCIWSYYPGEAELALLLLRSPQPQSSLYGLLLIHGIRICKGLSSLVFGDSVGIADYFYTAEDVE